MTTRRLSIESENAFKHRVLVDGHDLSIALGGLTLHMRAGQLTTAELKLNVIDVTQLGDVETRIAFGTGVKEALIALGWTPPLDEATPEQRAVRHGTDDCFPYGGSWDEGRDYTIICYCGAQFTGETDGSVEAELDEHVDQMERERDEATTQPTTPGAMLDQLDLAPALEAGERIQQALVLATVAKDLPDGSMKYRTVALTPAAADRLGLSYLLDFASSRAREFIAGRNGL